MTLAKRMRATATLIGASPIFLTTGLMPAAAAEWAPVVQWRLDNGPNSVYEFESTDELNPGDRDVRLSIRLRTTHTPDEPDWDLIRKGYTPDSATLYKVEYWPSGQASYGFRGTQGSTLLRDGPDLSDGEWHTVVCTKTAKAVRLEVDGETVASEEKEIGDISNDDPVVISARRSASKGELFKGELADARMEVSSG